MIIYSEDTLNVKGQTVAVDVIQDAKITPSGVVFLLLKQVVTGFPGRIVRVDDQEETLEISTYYNLV